MTQETTQPAAPEAKDLRCEYAAAEHHIGTLNSAVWRSAAIVVGGSIAAFAVLLNAPGTRPVAVGVAVLAFGAIVVTAMWRHNWSRHKVSIGNHWVRMREIEKQRGMQMNRDLYLLAQRRDGPEKPKEGEKSEKGDKATEWDSLCEGEQERLLRTYKPFPEPPRVLHWLSLCKFKGTGQDVLQGTAFLVQVGWVLIAVFKLVDAFACW